MGRRMKSTKSGKYINPTDQARKEARKRELKKNKKQRLIVRVAVLKGKDPYQIISDMERLDRMEYDFYNPPALNEKVLKDKRRKLKETWDRLLRLYIKEDKDKYMELKRMEGDYNAKRNELAKQYEAIKSAQEVNIEDIPLPSAISLPSESSTTTPSLGKDMIPQSILKNTKNRTKQPPPPGCPPGLPPSLKEFMAESDDEDDDDNEDDVEKIESNNKKIRFSDEVDDEKNKNESDLHKFLQEIEQLSSDNKPKEAEPNKNIIKDVQVAPNSSIILTGSTLIQPAPQILVRPTPPPPPPVQVQIPPQLMHTPGQVLRMSVATHNNPTIFNPSNYHQKKEKTKQLATIEARPQLRNLSADSTKFMPLALRVRRDEKQAPRKSMVKPARMYGMIHSLDTSSSSTTLSNNVKDKTNSKDDAYEQFMKEMGGLI
ncbi:hypothetical protein HUG17_1253 [Dermatophagoides farinae]|uniref:Wbp11/ELF5/Saf1 N-terminal domain-containing protein n=1 Tax=Dermatophagoides farinae TaxID=6954 RepID=A0A9D4SLP9_DERFA|nr:WW domain-binding protein 11-like [Dermatophagoides farinae]KAH7645715.1 hypothetical protein HUG17_1253 [Dermatophagoides farinae]